MNFDALFHAGEKETNGFKQKYIIRRLQDFGKVQSYVYNSPSSSVCFVILQLSRAHSGRWTNKDKYLHFNNFNHERGVTVSRR